MKTSNSNSGNYFPENKEDNEVLDPARLIELFRKIEKKQTVTKRIVAICNLVLFIIYVAIASNQTGKIAAGYHLCGLGFVAGAVYLYLRYRPLPSSAYALPIMDYLRKTEKRLRYFTRVDYLILIPILVTIGIGGGLILTDRLLHYTDRQGLITIIWTVFFIGLCVFGYFAGRKNWRRDNGSIHEAIKQTLVKMNGDGSL